MIKKLTIALALMVCTLAAGGSSKAQNVALKTNLVYDALLNANLGLEFKTAKKWSLDISGNYNGWTLDDNKKWKHWMVQPEMRLWLCEAFMGNFFGLELHGGQYNVGGLKNSISFLGTDFSRLGKERFEGWFAGAGLTWGHSWILATHWNMEVELGIGWSYTHSNVFENKKEGLKIEDDLVHNYFGPTKAAFSLVYVF